MPETRGPWFVSHCETRTRHSQSLRAHDNYLSFRTIKAPELLTVRSTSAKTAIRYRR